MYIDNVRSFAQGILLLVFAAIAYWGDTQIGLALVGLMGVMKLQEKRHRLVSFGPHLATDRDEEARRGTADMTSPRRRH